MSENTKHVSYADAGVDTAEGARAVDAIKAAVAATNRPEVIGGLGGFGSCFSAAALKDMEEPILVSGTDGVGTKLAIAQLLDRHETVGEDLVAMCVDDIVPMGAEPLFFLDYVAIGKLRAEHDAILIGRVTAERDNAQLNVRHWSGPDPLRIVIDRNRPFFPGLDFDRPVVPQILDELYRRGVQSLLVEGGAFTHATFIGSGMWDEIRVETAPVAVGDGTKAPQLPQDIEVTGSKTYDGNTIVTYGHARHKDI